MSNSPSGQPPYPEWQPNEPTPWDRPTPWDQQAPWDQPTPGDQSGSIGHPGQGTQPTPSLPPVPPAPDWGPSAAYQAAPDYEVPAGQYQQQPPPYQQPYGVVVPTGNPYASNPYGPNPYASNPYGPTPYAANPYAPSPYAPYGIDPVTGIPYSDKSKLVAGLLQIFLGGLGVGRFYLGDPGIAIAQILVTFITFGFGMLWPVIDGIVLLAGSPRDKNGRPLRS